MTDTSLLDSSELLRIKQRFSIAGNSPALMGAIGRAVIVAPIDLSVMVVGESGTGKEFFPKIIHFSGARKHKKYIAVNCGAIPEGTIDSELFGHEKGAFTGAVASRKGYFEEADGGTIFLDEVAELPLTTQARLLRVLETGEFLKVGSSQVQHTDVRIVAATNVDLRKAVADGKFRADLFYRLSTVEIIVPPLRDRGDDIVLLARKFATDFAERYLTPIITFGEDARRALLRYSWPGNVRQLKNVVEQLSLFRAGREITADDLTDILPAITPATPASRRNTMDYEAERDLLWQTIFSLRSEIDELRRNIGKDAAQPVSPAVVELPSTRSLIVPSEEADIYRIASRPATLEDSEREMILHTLEKNGGSRRTTARELGISERTLYRKLREYGIDRQH